MAGDIDEGPLIVLAVDFDERAAEAFEHLDAHRLIIDEGPGSSIIELDPAEQQLILSGNIVCSQQLPGRMIVGNIECRGDLAVLGGVAHEARIAAGTQCERERIE